VSQRRPGCCEAARASVVVFLLSFLLAIATTGFSSSGLDADMTLVPAGEFLMGSPEGTDGFPDERPQRRVFLSAFWIDRREVTNADYESFVRATGHQPPVNANPSASLWDNGSPLPSSKTHPVVNVSWDDALTFCQWKGGRLPTEAEWEKAARGTDGRRYPWGDHWDHAFSNSASYWAGRTVEFNSGDDWNAFWVKGEGAKISRERGLKGEVLTLPVGSFENAASPYGLLDMAGNASEWVQDWYDPDFYKKGPVSDPQGPERGAVKVQRGGSWLKPALSLRTSDRDYGNPNSRPSGAGIRCAKDAY
jgi:formylglycine-generating enzyme required for sulfatase activity